MIKIEEKEKNIRKYLSDRGKLIGTAIGAGIGLYAGQKFVDSITIQDFPMVIDYSLRGLFLVFNTALARKIGEYSGDMGGFVLHKLDKCYKKRLETINLEEMKKNVTNDKDLLEYKVKNHSFNMLI